MKKQEKLPEILEKSNNATTLEEFFKPFGINKIFISQNIFNKSLSRNQNYCFTAKIIGNSFEFDQYCGASHHSIYADENTLINYVDSAYLQEHFEAINNYLVFHFNNYYRKPDSYGIIYFDGKNVYKTQLSFSPSHGYSIAENFNAINLGKKILEEIKFSIESDWEKLTANNRIYGFDNSVLQTVGELTNMLKTEYPFTYQFMKENYDDTASKEFLCYPEMETLIKAGYKGLKEIFEKICGLGYFSNTYRNENDIKKLNILLKKGNSPKEIIQMSQPLAKALKDCSRIEVWDIYRKLEKKNYLTTNALIDMYEQGYTHSQMDNIKTILRREYNGKAIFNPESLVNYLGRLDRFEAIERDEGITLINDYLRMCEQLNIKPKVDGDSLKREHDVCARLCRNIRQKEFEQGIEKHGKELLPLSYSDSTYSISPIKDYDDLIEEANTMHNCVASYAGPISKGKTHVFSLKKQDKKYATVEIRLGDDVYIKQAYQAYNKPITKEAQDFLNKWISHITVNKIRVA